MVTDALHPTAFQGDSDIPELHEFFQPARQFAGDTRWTFGTSLKAAYVNCFEFMNHAPVVTFWRDSASTLQAVSRLSLGPGEWFHQAAPGFRGADIAREIVARADAAFELLTDHESWTTVRYQGNHAESELLESLGYVNDGFAEVYMVRTLAQSLDPVAVPAAIEVRLLDTENPLEVRERAAAQCDAFSGGASPPAQAAWMERSLPHQLAYGVPGEEPNVVAIDDNRSILAFADVFLDRENKIGEFEPVGTRTSSQRTGLAKAVTFRGLNEMRDAGMGQAVVRTGLDNPAAIAAYESVGFQVVDQLVRYRKHR